MQAEERAEFAASCKKSGECNCCQAVMRAYFPDIPLQFVSAGFAGGMGCMESTCGALIGACMVLGLCTQGNGTVSLSRKLLQSFKEKCGATICGELKGIKTGKVLCACEDCVRNAVLSLEELLPNS